MSDNMFICLFEVQYLDEVNIETKSECGMIFASSFEDAAHYLEQELYGDNLLKITHLELLDTSPIFSKDLWSKMRKELMKNEC